MTILKKYMPHLMFFGMSGVGKTACAYMLKNALGTTMVELNSSDERGIDFVRNKLSLVVKVLKIVILYTDSRAGSGRSEFSRGVL